jgi:hypothetical protein
VVLVIGAGIAATLRRPCGKQLEGPILTHDGGHLRVVDAVWTCGRRHGHAFPGWHLGRSAQVSGRRLWLAGRRFSVTRSRS